MVKILHTSDWHLGRTLYTRKRYAEFEAFLGWLLEEIDREQIDVLLIAGDVFDTTAPSNAAQALYYRFLCRIAVSYCRHVVVIAGNHDSPSFLNAPKELLKTLDVHVVGSITENHNDEVIVLNNQENTPELIVCAVPYLRDRDIRVVETGESIDDKERKLIEGIRNHYAEVFALAEQKRCELDNIVPIVVMGHLFTTGGKTVEGDGVRDLYVGSLAHVSANIFPQKLDYLALGHLHMPQKVNDSEIMRYCGSPLPMGFGEATQQKCVVMVDFCTQTETSFNASSSNQQSNTKLLPIPIFQKLERIQGDWETISARIMELSAARSQAWLEVIYQGNELISDLRGRLDAAIAETQLEILCVKNTRIIERILNQIDDAKTLDDMSVQDVFQRCLDVNDIPDNQRQELLHAYEETVMSIYEDDTRAQ